MAKLKKQEVENIKEELEVVEKVKDKPNIKVKKELTREELIMALNKVEDELLVDFKNISSSLVLYADKFGDLLLNLEPGETETLRLKTAKEICKVKGYFKDGTLIVNKVYSDDFSLSDILKYLKLDRVQKNTHDELEELVLADLDEFENVLRNNTKNKSFIKNVAAKAIFMHTSDDYDFELSLKKERVLSEILNLDTLIY